jgi:hypothetical protein
MDSWKIFALIAAIGCGFTSKAQSSIREPLDQSSRLTSLVISEIMYHPAERADGRQLEYVELFNSSSTFEEIGGYRLAGDIAYTFPTNTTIPARSFLVVARNPQDLRAVYGITNVVGPFTGNLPNDGGSVRLRHRTGAIFLEVNYGTSAPWPVSADGAGHSLVLTRPSYGERSPAAWAASHSIGGSPGGPEPAAVDPAETISINEFLAHTDDPELDYIELYNRSNGSVDLAGCVLTDDAATNKFVFPANSIISARGFLVLSQTELGFSLSADGERIFFKNASRTRVLDSVRFGGQENGVSTGRYPDGAAEFYRLQTKTPGAANSGILVSEVAINELMYHPISKEDAEQYVELHNRSAAAVNLSGWRLEDGISFTFPANTTIPANGYLVVARDAARLRSNYANLTSENMVGNFSGRLARSGERVALAKPDTNITVDANGAIRTNLFYIAVEEVSYGDGGRWGEWSDGGGSSLERIDARADSRQASNWADSDETQKSAWTTVTRTGRLDLGNVAADQLQVLLQGSGECLIDDVEVVTSAGANVVPNSTFETGSAGWFAEGTQSLSSWEQSDGFNSARSFHVRAVERGDNQVNRIRANLSQSLAANSTATIRAKVRWLKGHPEVLFRLRGNWLDVPGIMNLPKNPGTPGARNSRALESTGPAIYEVGHFPVLPSANQATTVSARVNDPDGVASMVLRYRMDPSSTFVSVTMVDNGTAGDAVAGDGVFSGRIPGQAAGTLAAYQITASDGRGAATTFPNGREHLVRFGETTPSGTFPVYRMWMTAATHSRWSNRSKLDNTPLPVTFVLGNHRVVQGATALFAGSPYISPGYNTPTGNRCGYTVGFPKDDRFLNDTDLVLDWPGGHGNERTAMQEQMGYWIADQMDLPYSHRYWIRLHVNGVTDMQRGTVFEAVIQPNGDFLDAWLPDAEAVDFYKIDRAFEFSDSGSRVADPMPRLENYTTVGGAKKTERYRWMFMKRAYDSANDYSNIFALVDAVNATTPEPYTSRTEGLIELEDWMGILAVEHIIGNFDAYGHEIGKNMYAAKPNNGKWQLYMFELDWLMLAGVNYNARYAPSTAPLFNGDDPTIIRMYNHPPFRRAYFRAIKKAVEGPFRAEKYEALMDAKYAALLANGITMCDGQTLTSPAAVKNWFAVRRVFLENQLNAVAANFEITSNGGANFNTDLGSMVLVGKAPVEVKSIRVNGAEHPVTWTSINDWRMTVPLYNGANSIMIEAMDADGAPLGSYRDEIVITSSTTTQPPQPLSIFINEWMAVNNGSLTDPTDGDWDDWFELYNPNAVAVNLSGYLLADSLTNVAARWSIPSGVIIPAGGFLLVWADGEPGQFQTGSNELHANFRLSQDGESIALFTPSGVLVDSVTFGRQSADVSEGRSPDGSANIQQLDSPTPSRTNVPLALRARTSEEGLVLSWSAQPGKRYRLHSKTSLAESAWTAGPEIVANSALASWTVPIGGSQRFFRIEALP